SEVITERSYTCYACAIMPDHVHILIRKHRDTVEEMAIALMKRSRETLIRADRRSKDHPTWTGGTGWSVFLEHPQEIRRTIPYIEKNPEKIRLPRQHWPFVKDYDDWPLHKGHSPNSPD